MLLRRITKFFLKLLMTKWPPFLRRALARDLLPERQAVGLGGGDVVVAAPRQGMAGRPTEHGGTFFSLKNNFMGK